MPFWAGGTDSGGGEEAAGRAHLPLRGGERENDRWSLCREWPVRAADPDCMQRKSTSFPNAS